MTMKTGWESKTDYTGNRFDTFHVERDCNSPGQFVMLYKDGRGFYFSYYIDVETIFFQEKLEVNDWDEARKKALFRVERYIEEKRLQWQAMQYHLWEARKK